MTSVVDTVSVEGNDSGIHMAIVTVPYTLLCNLDIKLYEQLLYCIVLHYYSATLLYDNYVSVM